MTFADVSWYCGLKMANCNFICVHQKIRSICSSHPQIKPLCNQPAFWIAYNLDKRSMNGWLSRKKCNVLPCNGFSKEAVSPSLGFRGLELCSWKKKELKCPGWPRHPLGGNLSPEPLFRGRNKSFCFRRSVPPGVQCHLALPSFATQKLQKSQGRVLSGQADICTTVGE